MLDGISYMDRLLVIVNGVTTHAFSHVLNGKNTYTILHTVIRCLYIGLWIYRLWLVKGLSKAKAQSYQKVIKT